MNPEKLRHLQDGVEIDRQTEDWPIWLDYWEDDVACIEVWTCVECDAAHTRTLGTIDRFDPDFIDHTQTCSHWRD